MLSLSKYEGLLSREPPRIFDRAAYRAHRQRAAAMGGDTFLARDAAEHIAERLAAVNRTFERALDVDSRDDSFRRFAKFASQWSRITFSPPVTTGEEKKGPSAGPDEVLPFAPESFDLVVSVLSLHAVNDLPGALVQIRRVLKPDGLFIAALFGGETLHELRTAFAAAEAELKGGVSPRVAPFADVRDLGGLLQRVGLALPVADVERTVARYRELDGLFADLRALGETNVLAGRQRFFLSRRLLAAVALEYATRFADEDGKLRATFDIVYLTGWAPHESQQKPLRPGSAKMRLADALGTREQLPAKKPR